MDEFEREFKLWLQIWWGALKRNPSSLLAMVLLLIITVAMTLGLVFDS